MLGKTGPSPRELHEPRMYWPDAQDYPRNRTHSACDKLKTFSIDSSIQTLCLVSFVLDELRTKTAASKSGELQHQLQEVPVRSEK